MKHPLMAAFAMLVVATLIVSCAPQTPPTPPLNPVKPTEPGGQPGPAVPQGPITVTPSDATPAASAAEAADSFALDMYKNLAKMQGNVFFSPISIHDALTMTYEGAKGDTAKEMAGVLHLPADMTEVRAFYTALLGRTSDKYELAVANAIWAQKGFSFLPSFTGTLTDQYKAEARDLDFAGDAEGSRTTINGWVEDKTKDRIKDLIPKGTLDAMTRAVLTNAIYMKADWQSQFEKESTYDEDFTLASGSTKSVSMMHQMKTFKYADDDTVQVLEMPYVGDDLLMRVILPRDAKGVDALDISLEKFASWKKTGYRQVRVSMPKTEMTQSFSLKDVLAGMGMPLAFDSGNADFSGMTGKKDLFISAVIHKSFVKVDEKGTEAAAATAVVVGMTSMPSEEPPIPFKADHPFIVTIEDKASGAILFMGRVVDP